MARRRTRFAPSPTGYLHIGHALAALAVEGLARESGAEILLRIEDVDATRCRPEHDAAILEDLAWLGFEWDQLVRQSDRLARYREVLAGLLERELAYPCFCSRKDIADADPQAGPEGPIYPGTCRALDPAAASARMAKEPYALRLDTGRAAAETGPLEWQDMDGARHPVDPHLLGDVLLASRDRPASYHLAVVVDDGDMQITDVVRGRDLLLATHVQRLLQALLGLAAPRYRHHPLLVDAEGRKLAKRHGDLMLRTLRAGGTSAAELRAALRRNEFPAGIRLDHA